MADNTRSPEEIARLNARMAEIDKYLKDPTMKLGRGPTGKFQFYKADQRKQATSVSPKKTSTATSTATTTKTSTPTATSSTPPSPKTSRQYDEDTRTALQQLGPRRGVTTESITKPSAGDAAKISAYKADQERQARNVERGRDLGIAAASLAPIVGPGLGLGARGVVKGAQALKSAAPRLLPAPAKRLPAPAKRLPAPEIAKSAAKPTTTAGRAASRFSKITEEAKKFIGKGGDPEAATNTYMKARAAARNPNLPKIVQGRLNRREITGEEAADQLMGLKKGGSVRPGKVGTVMREFKAGKLKSSSGQKVSNPKQAIAIAMSEAGMKKPKKFAGKEGSYVGGQSKAPTTKEMTPKDLEAMGRTEVANQEAMRKAREEAKKNAAAPKRYAKGGEVGESKTMMKKEVAFMKRKGAPKSMIKHEEKEAKGMKSGGSAKCYAKGGAVRADGCATKGKTRGKMV